MIRSYTLALVAALTFGMQAAPDESLAADATSTVITVQVSDMHCATCANKIARKIYAVPGVVRVQADLKRHSASITPQKDATPSPRAIWEAVEKAGFKPVKLDAPSGSFTAKPTT
jgi:Cu+-exporting ATPase